MVDVVMVDVVVVDVLHGHVDARAAEHGAIGDTPEIWTWEIGEMGRSVEMGEIGRDRSRSVGRDSHSEFIRGHQRPSKVIRGHQRPSVDKFCTRGSGFRAALAASHPSVPEEERGGGHQRSSEPSEAIRSNKRPSGDMRCKLAYIAQ